MKNITKIAGKGGLRQVRLKNWRWALIFAAVLAGIVYRSVPPGTPAEIAGRADVRDGDSIDVGRHRVRLEGIDAPELAQTCLRQGRSWPCGETARRHLSQLIADRPIVCRTRGRDQFDRYLGRCRAGDTDLNRAMVRDGMAVAFGQAYRDDELAARRSRTGLWDGSFERPQVWRHNNAR